MMFLQSLVRLVLRYRLLHVLFWGWQLVSLTHVLEERHGGSAQHNLISAGLQILCEMLAVYTTVYWLMPRYFNKSRYLAFAAATLAAILASAFLSAVADDLFNYFTRHRHIRSYFIKTLSSVFDTAVVTGIFVAIVIVQNRLKADRRARQRANEQVRAELEFLKAQINPHFLFNTINNIYVLIEEEPKQGSHMLLRFSELLRYQLYECGEGPVHIGRELHFLRNFIAMEQLRIGEAVEVTVDIPEEQDYFEIHPFLLLPFVENAFKHVSRHDHARNFISIRAVSAQGTFQLTVWNSSHELPSKAPGGIGLINVRRRLELLYPGRYELHLREDYDIHHLDLKIHVR